MFSDGAPPGGYRQRISFPLANRVFTSLVREVTTPSVPVVTADVAIRLGKSSSWVGRYRASLVSAQVVEPAGRGRVRYAIPRFGDWMRERVDA